MHVFATFMLAALPFIFFLVFAELSKVTVYSLFADILVSSLRMLVAYVIAMVIAWTSAVLFYKGTRSRIALPLADVLQSFPTFAALPLAVYFWGPSNVTVISFLVLSILWPAFFTIISSLKLVKSEWTEAVELSQLHGFDYIRQFLIPVSMPGIITGSIIGLGDGWEALVATEIIVNIKTGLGPFFNQYSHDTTITIFGILGLLIFLFAINKIIFLPLLDKSHALIEE